MSAHARHKAVRVLYHTKTAFKKSAKALGIMDDFKAGVPRMAYRGVVSVINRQDSAVCRLFCNLQRVTLITEIDSVASIVNLGQGDQQVPIFC